MLIGMIANFNWRPEDTAPLKVTIELFLRAKWLLLAGGCLWE